MATVTPSSNPRIPNPADHTKTTPSTARGPCPVDILNGGLQCYGLLRPQRGVVQAAEERGQLRV
jgi:hypothetical protein